jgi:hypothetical protein
VYFTNFYFITMSSLISASIKLSEIKKIDQNKIIKGEKDSYIPVTISVNDESRYGKNVSVYIQQSKEEREAKSERHYIANGSVIWTDGSIVKGQREDDGNNISAPKQSAPSLGGGLDDLPF